MIPLPPINYDILFLTGAGLSTVANIPDYKTIDETWPFKNSRIDSLSIYMFKHDPITFWKAFNYCHPRKIMDAQPTRIHNYITELSKHYKIAVATQNIDGLHSKSGLKYAVELHGNLNELICTNYMNAGGCGTVYPFSNFIPIEYPTCPNCLKLLKPNCSLYGEGVNNLGFVREAAKNSKVIVALGTSLTVPPVNELFLDYNYRENRPKMVWINKGDAPDIFNFDHSLKTDFNNYYGLSTIEDTLFDTLGQNEHNRPHINKTFYTYKTVSSKRIDFD